MLAARGTEHGSGVGVFRWFVERANSWLHLAYFVPGKIARRLVWAGMPCRGMRWSPSTVRAILARAIATVAMGLA